VVKDIFIKPNPQLDAIIARSNRGFTSQAVASIKPERPETLNFEAKDETSGSESIDARLKEMRSQTAELGREISSLQGEINRLPSPTPILNGIFLLHGVFCILIATIGAGSIFWLVGAGGLGWGLFNIRWDSSAKSERAAHMARLADARKELQECRNRITPLTKEKLKADQIALETARKIEASKLAKQQEAAALEQREQERRLSVRRRTLEYWLGLDGHLFEKEFAVLLAKHGWKAEVTRASGDGGIDIVGRSPSGQRTAIQCKRWKNRVGAPYVRDLKGAASIDMFDRMVVIGTGGFTADAQNFASSAGVELWDENTLYSLITEVDAGVQS
jgi:HJR/Mrr/RecB family endonuclease